VSFTHTQWRDAVHHSAAELARIALGFAAPTTIEPAALVDTEQLVGAHVPLVGRPSYELWFVASRESCAALAEAMLGGMDLSTLPPAVINDAVCELVNMLAGGVKRRLVGSDLELGLPVFVSGSASVSDRLSATAFRLQLGAVETHAVVLGPR
jgi:CheY-specific phosphatase CheX